MTINTTYCLHKIFTPFLVHLNKKKKTMMDEMLKNAISLPATASVRKRKMPDMNETKDTINLCILHIFDIHEISSDIDCPR